MSVVLGELSLDVIYDDGVFTAVYPDGVTEATNLSNELYGMQRLGTILNKVKDMSPQEILPAIKQDIDEFVGEADQFDDITMLCLEYKEKMKPSEEDAQ